MYFIVAGDTHGSTERLCEVLRETNADGLLFTGDHYPEGLELARELRLDFYGVVGNCDPGVDGPREIILDIEGHRLYLCHGHQYQVKSTLQSIYYRGAEAGADIVVFGHTHIPLCEQVNGIWLINPGSATRPRHKSPGTYITLEISPSLISAAIHQIPPPGSP